MSCQRDYCEPGFAGHLALAAVYGAWSEDLGLYLQAMHAFRDNESTLLLATPAASRGLDLPAVGFVYSLGAPADAIDYLHRAGRAGRIGSPVNATVSRNRFLG